MGTVPQHLKQAFADRYRIERELGRGGMATVYLAEDVKHHRQVAIKVLAPELAAGFETERFQREIEIVARLSHPHIVALFDSGVVGNQPYYVMPHIAGESLRARLDRERQVPLEEALRLTDQVTSALGYAHARGLVHRDIKPENILLADGMAMVADFGLARASADLALTSLTTTGFALGTPLYMSPEQIRGSAELDGRADLYSLACTLYEMLAGEPPFDGSTLGSIIQQHLLARPRPVTELQSSVPESVARVLGKGLAKSPADRYATGAQFAEALRVAVMGGASAVDWEGAARHNLPRHHTRFVAREGALAQCLRLLDSTRLLTLTGVGGCGKTRLAIRLAERQLEFFADGVWFVDLAPLVDGERVAQAVATVLGVREEPGRPLEEQVAQHLAGKRALLVLDNCEHLLAACGALAAALLGAGEGIQLVATSREALGIEGEQLYAVGPLALPEVGADHDLGRIKASEAVQLFLDRAGLIAPDFELGDENGAAVAEICRRLDGIPLALELAAARIKVLSPGQILSRLEDRFRLLTGGSKTGLARHQTLRATLQWSYEQLAPEERGLFQAIAVFSGGWTLEAATAVVAGADEEFEVLDRLTRLVGKSLVLVERAGSREPRYRMLETVRQYAQGRLRETPQHFEVSRRHLAWILSLAEQAVSSAPAYWDQALLERFDREHDNARAALEWSLSEGAPIEDGLRLATAVTGFWTSRGFFSEGRQWFERLLERGAGASASVRAKAKNSACILALFQSDLEAALTWGRESLALNREAGDPRGAAAVLNNLGRVELARGNLESALPYLEESLAIYRTCGDRRAVGTLLGGLGQLAVSGQERERGVALLEESLAVFRELDYQRGIASALGKLAWATGLQGDHQRALGLHKESLERWQRMGEITSIAEGLEKIALTESASGRHARAVVLLGGAQSIRDSIGSPPLPVGASDNQQAMAAARAATGDEAVEAAWARGHAMTMEQVLSLALEDN